MADSCDKSVADVLHSGFVGQGSKVEQFEKLLKQFFKTPYVNTVNSATSALHLALHMIKEFSSTRNQVISVPLTCTATNTSIINNGLDIKWADVDYNNCNIDLDDLEKKIDEKTLAVMVVHWGGYPVDMNRLDEILDAAKIKNGFRPFVIEDCAHAFGSTYQNKNVGTKNFAAYSFQAIKHLTTGDGGALLCPNSYFHERAKLLRWYGLDRTTKADFRCEQMIHEAGFKFHMNDIAASIGIENFKHIDFIIEKHKLNAKYLRENLKSVKILECEDDRQSAEWIFTVLVENRERFIRKMHEKQIAVSRVHDRNDKHPCFKNYASSLPKTSSLCNDMICLPCGWWLDQDQLYYIVQNVNEGW